MTEQTKVLSAQEWATVCRALLHDVTVTKLAYLNKQQTQEAVYAAADRYLAALRQYKRVKRDKKMRIPQRTQIVNWA
jgi:hypothetical protein